MKFSYTLSQDASGWLAECVESDAAGTGPTPEEAVASLRRSLEERMFRPDAVAPPSENPHAPIVLERAAQTKPRSSFA